MTDPSTWCPYDLAVKASAAYDGLGFVLTEQDPYTLIDLDGPQEDPAELARQLKIYEYFDSYSERSPSEEGLHIVVKGRVPAGRKRLSVELYSSERYMTCTGNVFEGRHAIKDYTEPLLALWHELETTVNKELTGYQQCLDTEARHEDTAIIAQASTAKNGDLFKNIYKGDWQNHYDSQSQADFSLINIISYYTQNKDQIKRIFRGSGLGQRKKASREDYVNTMILRSFDQQIALVPITDIKKATQEIIKSVEVVDETQPIHTDIERPPGLLGDLAEFAYASSVRPVQHAAVVAVIALLAGIVGRTYNISGTGLNQYLLFLAGTGVGKSCISSSTHKIMRKVIEKIPAAEMFLGFSSVASGAALLNYIPEHPCSFSIVGEIGLHFQQLTHKYASKDDLAVRRVLLDLYTRSGEGESLLTHIYANKEKNTKNIASPAFTMVGESTPETFYSAIDETVIADGLLPRFTLVEYRGERPERNLGHEYAQLPDAALNKLREITVHCLKLTQQCTVVKVTCTEDAKKILDDFDLYCDRRIRESPEDVTKHLYTRAHLKVLRLAALASVGVNYMSPIITKIEAEWALNLIKNTTEDLSGKFKKGVCGNNIQLKQDEILTQTVFNFVKQDFSHFSSYGVRRLMHDSHIIPYSYLQRRLVGMADFRNDPAGSTKAIQRSLETLQMSGVISVVNAKQIEDTFKYSGKAYKLN